MHRPLVRAGGKLASVLATVLAVLLVCFALSALTPRDAFAHAETDPALSPAALVTLRARYFPGESMEARFEFWIAGVAHGDFGYSLAFHRPVARLLGKRALATLELLGLAFVFAWIVGFGWALLEAVCVRRFWSRWLRAGGRLLAAAWMALPVGVVALLALLMVPLSWLVAAELPSNHALPWLAALVLAFEFIPAIYLQAAGALAAVWRQPFIAASRAHGRSLPRVVLRQALPNTFDRLLPLASLTISQLLVDTVIVETLLGWPGLGQMAVLGAAQHDMPLVSAVVLLASLIVIATTLLADTLRYWTDPRLRWA